MVGVDAVWEGEVVARKVVRIAAWVEEAEGAED